MKWIAAILAVGGLLVTQVANAQNLQLDWSFSVTGTDDINATDFAFDPLGNIVVVGIFDDTLKVNTISGLKVLPVAGNIRHDAFVLKVAPNGTCLWAYAFGGTWDDDANDVEIDDQGNIYIGGVFSRTVDFDFGPGIDNVIAGNGSNGAEAFLLSLDASGNYRFVKTFDTQGSSEVEQMRIKDGYIYCTGKASRYTDMDPDPVGVSYVLGDTSNNVFYARLDLNGNLQWAGNVSSANTIYPADIYVAPDKSVYVLARYSYSVLVDTGLGTLNLTATGGSSTDGMLLKLDSAGNHVWVHTLGGSFSDDTYRVLVNSERDIVLTGYFQGTMDFDPGPGTHNYSLTGNYGMYVLCLDENAQFKWVDVFEGASANWQMELDVADNIYLTLFATASTDLDPGPGYKSMDAADNSDFVAMRLAATGELVWAYQFYGVENPLGIAPLDSSVYMFFSYDSTYFKVDTSVYSWFQPDKQTFYDADLAIVKFDQNVCASFTPVIDSALDITCNTVGFASVTAINGVKPYSFNWAPGASLDSGIIVTSPGIYRVSVADVSGCEQVRGVLINGPAQQDVDLQVVPVLPQFSPGFHRTITLNVFNSGCVSTSGNVSFVLDSNIHFTSSNPNPDFISGDTLFWSFTALTYDSAFLSYQIYVLADSSLNFGDLVCFSTSVSLPAGDVDPANNDWAGCTEVVNAYDPNDKQVFPAGVCDNNYVLLGSPLTYTVRFQNTGNAPATNIYIMDTLAGAFDPNTLRIKAASHDLTLTEIIDSNIFKFRFDNIYLPDSNNNEPASHGYIMFEVWPKAFVTSGTVAQNRAGIYFDNNSVVLTNTLSNTLVDTIPQINAVVLVTGDSLVALMTGADYQWVSCDNNFDPVPGQTTRIFEPADSGYYAVYIDYLSCHAYSECVFFKPTDSLTTGLSTAEETTISIFPNPTEGKVEAAFGKTHSYVTISVADITGKQVALFSGHDTDRIRIDMEVPDGLYIFSVTNADGETARFKVLKQ